MSAPRPTFPPAALTAFDLSLCRRLNRFGVGKSLALFRAASRFGDGPGWLALVVLLPILVGAPAWSAVAQLLSITPICLFVYRWLKVRIGRPRPYAAEAAIFRGVPAPDEFSFPSGHTLHSVAYTAVLVGHFPVFAWGLVPLAALIGLSRVALGLHYPSDVAAGAVLGLVVAGLSFAVF